ncbi:MAG: hypothetical protein ABI164_11855 [Acidobacteriaceae bacterium]
MRYLRLFVVLFLSTLVITGCHRRPERAVPPPQAQAPIVTTLPPIPPLTFPDVQLVKPKPPAPVVEVVTTPPPPRKHAKRVRHHRTIHRAESDLASNEPAMAGPGAHSADAQPSDSPSNSATLGSSGSSVLGQLSADDATVNPHQNVQTQHLIEHTEVRLKRLSRSQQSRHKDAVVQVESFLEQAKQAWTMNDIVGATTLANKAKILLDELSK